MMNYEKWLKKERKCPFCFLKSEEIIKGNRYAVLILAKAPYCKDHLLVAPKKHYSSLASMSREEKDGTERLIYYGMKVLHKRYKNVTILYREGNLKEVGKSIEHLHYHLIPEIQIGPWKFSWRRRRIFGEGEYLKKTGEFRGRFV